MAWLKGKQISKSHVKGGTTIVDFKIKKNCVSLNTMREIRLYGIVARRMLIIVKMIFFCLTDWHATDHQEKKETNMETKTEKKNNLVALMWQRDIIQLYWYQIMNDRLKKKC